MGSITLNMVNALADAVGPEHGITSSEWEAIAPRVEAGHAKLMERRAAGRLGFADLPFDEAQIASILPIAKQVRHRFDHLVVLGIGGSSLGLRCMSSALLNPAVTMSDRLDRRSVPKLHIFDNIDPDLFIPFLQQLDLKKTCINIISKSGKTAETAAQLLIVRDMLEKRFGSQRWKEHVVVTTDPASGPLRAMVICEGLQSFPIPSNVGGRFSSLSPVGLFPAACAGIDIVALLGGARTMAERCFEGKFAGNVAAELAAAHYLLDTAHGKTMAVLMHYLSSLRDFGEWYVQILAESLGKDGKGQTPISAVGATDQHSQLQLFIEGPNNKMVTLLTTAQFHSDIKIPSTDEPTFQFLAGHTLGEVLNTEARAVRQALQEARRPNLHLQIPRLDEESLGQLMFLYEWQTALLGELYEINAFNQPGVERGKVLTREFLAR